MHEDDGDEAVVEPEVNERTPVELTKKLMVSVEKRVGRSGFGNS